jgi:flagellum-specific ATP synthase
VLSRTLAEAGTYPAIDVEASISRVMQQITTAEHLRLAQRLRQLYSQYQHNRDLIAVGAYKKGTDSRIDTAIDAWPGVLRYLEQHMQAKVGLEQSLSDLAQLLATVPETAHA